jgi:hypothetical protein
MTATTFWVFGCDAENPMPSYSHLLKRVHPEDRACCDTQLCPAKARLSAIEPATSSAITPAIDPAASPATAVDPSTLISSGPDQISPGPEPMTAAFSVKHARTPFMS